MSHRSAMQGTKISHIYDKNIQRLTFFHSSPLFSFFTGNDERIKLAVINCEQSLDVTSIIDPSSSCFRLTRWQAGGVMDHYNVLYMSRHRWIFFRQATVKTGWWWLEGYGVLKAMTCLKSVIFSKKMIFSNFFLRSKSTYVKLNYFFWHKVIFKK